MNKHLVTLIVIALLVGLSVSALAETKKTTTTTTVTTVTTTDQEDVAAMAPAIAEPKATTLPEQFSTKTIARGQTRPQVAPINEELTTPQPVQVVEKVIIVEKPVYVETPVYVQEPLYVAPAPVVSMGYTQVGRRSAFSVGFSTGYGSGCGYDSAPGYGYGPGYETQRLATEQASYRAQVQAADFRCQMSGQNRRGYHGNRR
jgi:hypothetical protein